MEDKVEISKEITAVSRRLSELMRSDIDVFKAVKFLFYDQLGVPKNEIQSIVNSLNGDIIQLNGNSSNMSIGNQPPEINYSMLKLAQIIQNRIPELVPFIKELMIYPLYREAVLKEWEIIKRNQVANY